MKWISTIFFLLSLSASADILRVESIDYGLNSSEPDLIFFSDGRIGSVPESKMNSLPKIGSFVDVTLGKNHQIKKMFKVAKTENISSDISQNKNDYVPTVLPDLQSVNKIFKRMNRGWQRDSQCYNRAHVWNYEEFKRSGLLSKKVFIFYTRRYIRDYNFMWWFHAIPTVLAYNQGSVVERYLDPMFARSPLTRKQWTDIFIKSRRDCPVITRYSEYRDNQETEHCYLHFSSMYYWQPRDLDKFERTGFEKKDFISSEINYAYWEAF